MKLLPPAVAIVLILSSALAFEPPTNSVVAVDDDFNRDELGKGWSVQTGSWTLVNGVLHSAEIPSDKHAAAARRSLETGDAVYQLKFRLGEGAKAFHFGFDPKRGTLDKKGHLFSVIITPGNWKLLKHLDKNRPEEDPNEILAKADFNFEPGVWYLLRVVTWGTTVKAMIEGANVEPLKGSHATFHVAKPTLVFRAVGSGIEIDDLRVWVPDF